MPGLPTYRTLILAGERPGGSPLSRHFGLDSSVMIPLADQPLLQRVLETNSQAKHTQGGWIVGPTAQVRGAHPQIDDWLALHNLVWHAPAASPASSALGVLNVAAEYPVLITTADHGLLQPHMLDEFIEQINALVGPTPDFVVGLVPYRNVQAEFGNNRRTLLRFRGGPYCGSNLFAVTSARGLGVFKFWQQMESDRKHPWRMAKHLGLGVLCRYLFRRLSLADASAHIGRLADAQIHCLSLPWPRAAVDVDSLDDWQLADQLLRS